MKASEGLLHYSCSCKNKKGAVSALRESNHNRCPRFFLTSPFSFSLTHQRHMKFIRPSHLFWSALPYCQNCSMSHIHAARISSNTRSSNARSNYVTAESTQRILKNKYIYILTTYILRKKCIVRYDRKKSVSYTARCFWLKIDVTDTRTG